MRLIALSISILLLFFFQRCQDFSKEKIRDDSSREEWVRKKENYNSLRKIQNSDDTICLGNNSHRLTFYHIYANKPEFSIELRKINSVYLLKLKEYTELFYAEEQDLLNPYFIKPFDYTSKHFKYNQNEALDELMQELYQLKSNDTIPLIYHGVRIYLDYCKNQKYTSQRFIQLFPMNLKKPFERLIRLAKYEKKWVNIIERIPLNSRQIWQGDTYNKPYSFDFR
jgi:hypothetical protein